jgi:hypothetical protein
MGFALFFRGALVPARANFERALALYDPQRHSDRNLLGGAQDFVVSCLSHLTLGLIVLGYPDQAVTRIREALTRAQELAHPYSLVYALVHAFTIHQLRLDIQAVHEYAETMIAICEEQEFAFWLAVGMFYQGWVLVAQGHGEEGVDQMRPGIAPSERLMAPYFHVNCDVPGQTITKVLKTAQSGDTIHVRGTCEETVTMTTDRVTLDGGSMAILQGPGGGQPGDVSHGLLNIVGVQGVEIRGFTVQNSAADGINGRQGAAFTVRDVRVFHSADDGIEVTETSTVRFLGTCEVRGSGEDGIAITRGSSTLFIAERVTTAENARGGIFVIGTSTAAFDTGTVHTTQNTFGILTLGHSSLTLGRNLPTILAEDNTLDGILVADTSDLRLDGGTITAARNRRTGLGFGGTGGLGNTRGIILSEYNTEGARAEDSSRIAQLIAGRMTIRNNTLGDPGRKCVSSIREK